MYEVVDDRGSGCLLLGTISRLVRYPHLGSHQDEATYDSLHFPATRGLHCFAPSEFLELICSSGAFEAYSYVVSTVKSGHPPRGRCHGCSCQVQASRLLYIRCRITHRPLVVHCYVALSNSDKHHLLRVHTTCAALSQNPCSLQTATVAPYRRCPMISNIARLVWVIYPLRRPYHGQTLIGQAAHNSHSGPRRSRRRWQRKGRKATL